MGNFSETWNRPPTTPVTERLQSIGKKEAPLKPRVENSVRKVSQSKSKLDYMVDRLEDKDAKLFQRIVKAQQAHDSKTCRVLANELAELRKNKKVLNNARLALDQVALRLTTFHDLGDAMVALAPAVATMKAVGPALGRFLPEVSGEFESISSTLGDVMMDSIGGDFEFSSGSNEESELILKEAAAVASNYIGDKFPSTPASVSSGLYSEN